MCIGLTYTSVIEVKPFAMYCSFMRVWMGGSGIHYSLKF